MIKTLLIRLAPRATNNGQQEARGMSLMEVVISIFVASIVLTGLAIYMTTSTRANFFARKLRTATLYAEQKLEDLKTAKIENITNGSDKIEGFTRRWIVSTDNINPRLKYVKITVSWTDILGKTHSVTIEDYIYKPL
jgi:Tfp pilus assembly protein PilV